MNVNFKIRHEISILVMILVLIPVNGHTQLTQITSSNANEYHPRWSPNGSNIAFTRRTDQDVGIWIITAMGGTAEQININKDGDLAFCWSPDGTKLVFDAYPSSGPPANLYILEISSGNIQQLTDFQGSENHPAWSPDGSRIVFTWGGEICTIQATGGTATKITSGYDDWHPCWSPEGLKIAFTSNRSGNNDIWIVLATGGTPTQLTTDPADDDRACWSPDGSKIAFESKRSGNVDVWILNLKDKSLEQLTHHNAYDSHADWSPDGSKIAFASQRSGNLDVWIIDVSTTQIKKTGYLCPEEFNLQQNYPNPFNTETIIPFIINKPSIITLQIYNSIGEEIQLKTVIGFYQDGFHLIKIDAGSLTSGTYFYKLSSSMSCTNAKKMSVLK